MIPPERPYLFEDGQNEGPGTDQYYAFLMTRADVFCSGEREAMIRGREGL